MKRIALTLAAALLALPATAQPGYFRVTGVASDDTLNVRAEPSADSADIGDLGPTATGIEVTGTNESGDWGRIIWQDGNGWISMNFLEPETLPAIPSTELPAGLLCGGTEPFWNIRYSETSALYSDIMGASVTMPIAGVMVAEGRPAFPVAITSGASGYGALAVIKPQICSDDMSDRDYPYSLTVILESEGKRRFLDGCCSLPLEAGSN
ncbi:SH3 domain-containing protein [Pseudoruegeria sp. HB172150]|uniref:SH3 domain-containing protein n=1 Tax=Pseudoruegeria sp. HB172150 TaxID=2721164 RepID=UPI001556B961|nr:SH3 domain-containing protein [Pseudoruegeria sp. HB172150]